MPAVRPLACLDLDGTLVDSRGPFATSMRAALAEEGLPDRAPTSLHRHLGPPLEETAALLVADAVTDGLVPADEAPARAEALLHAYRRHYRRLGVPATTVVAGVPEALAALAADGWRLVIVTAKIAPAAEAVLAATGLDAAVPTLYAPAPEERHVPKARSLARAIADHAALAGPGAAVAMVGDRRHDVAAAVACGVPGIGVTWAGDHGDELRAAGAAAILDRPADLPGALAALRPPADPEPVA